MPGTRRLEVGVVVTLTQGANRRRRAGALVSAIVLLVATAPGPAAGLRTVAPRRSPGCPTRAVPVAGRADVLGVRMRTDDACRDAVRLMASFHACLRAGGDEESCRSTGPSLRPDTTRLNTSFLRASPSAGTDVALGPEDPPVLVSTEAELRKAWADPLQTSIMLTADISLRSCQTGGPIRESLRPIMLDGERAFTIRQTCFEKRILRQDGTGFLVVKNITLTRGGNDGPGAAVTTRGEIVVMDSVVEENLAEEPGGASSRSDGRRSSGRSSPATSPTTTGVRSTPAAAVSRCTTRSSATTSSTAPAERSAPPATSSSSDPTWTATPPMVTAARSTPTRTAIDGHRLDRRREHRGRARGRDLHARWRRDHRQLDAQRQPRRRPRWRHLRRSRRHRHGLDDRPQRRRRPRRRRDLGPRRPLSSSNSTISNNYAEGQGGGILAAGTVGLVAHDHVRQRFAGRLERRWHHAAELRFVDRPAQRESTWGGSATRDPIAGSP